MLSSKLGWDQKMTWKQTGQSLRKNLSLASFAAKCTPQTFKLAIVIVIRYSFCFLVIALVSTLFTTLLRLNIPWQPGILSYLQTMLHTFRKQALQPTVVTVQYIVHVCYLVEMLWGTRTTVWQLNRHKWRQPCPSDTGWWQRHYWTGELWRHWGLATNLCSNTQRVRPSCRCVSPLVSLWASRTFKLT